MRVVDIRERSVSISRYLDPSIPSGGLTTSLVAVTIEGARAEPVTGFGFASIGRFAQGGLIRERFAPRLLAATEAELASDDGTSLDPRRAWAAMMKGEKPGGHGERCVAVGTLDMALWDAVAKSAELPLDRFLARALGREAAGRVPVYAGGGYRYPERDRVRLDEEMRRLVDLGFTRAKIKIGAGSLAEDLERLSTAAAVISAEHLAVDAMNAYDPPAARAAAAARARYGLWWFEDIGNPLDFETLAMVAAEYPGPIAAGEALFSLDEARLFERHGGLRRDRDVLLFDPVHCYGLPGFVPIVEHFEQHGWPRRAFWPHGGHLFALHVASALGLGGAEVNPLSFAPFGGLADGARPIDGVVATPEAPGIGFETKADLHRLFMELMA